MNLFTDPWPWYVGGPLIGLTVPLLLIGIGKPFGISSSLRHLCSACMPKSKLAYIRESNWLEESWNLFFVVGVLIGSYLAMNVFATKPLPLLPEHYRSLGGLAMLFDGCTSGHSIMGISSLKWPSLVATLSFFVGGLILTGIKSLL